MFETAGALVAFSSAANAGITVPAGDWTLDFGGNVNAYYTHTNYSGAGVSATNGVSGADVSRNQISTGLLPAASGIGGKTRQNELDIAFQFTFFTGTSSGSQLASVLPGLQGAAANGAGGGNTLNSRQAYMTFGDASWGTVTMGRNLGVFGSDAILSDMTLLGVGGNAGASGSSTLGRIGSGYMYADWIGQIAYTTPNWNGFQATVAATQPWDNKAVTGGDTSNSNIGWQGKVTYDFAANDVTGRVWASAIYQKHDANVANGVLGYDSTGFDVGAKAAYQGAELVGYYYNGDGLAGPQDGATGLLFLQGNESKDSGGYVQATFKVPGVGTKIGASWGESLSTQKTGGNEFKNEAWIVGAYHPLTKSLNLVAEYTDNKYENLYGGTDQMKAKTVSLGAILFF